MATSVLGLKTFSASDPVDYNEVNDNYTKIDNGVKTAMQGRAAKNLLDNSDFRNPVNQRGQSSYSGAVHGIDRWIGNDASSVVTVGTDGITASGNYLVQIIEKKYTGKTMTICAKDANGGIAVATCTVPNATSYSWLCTNTSSTGTFVGILQSNTGVLRAGIMNTNGIKIVWAALYEGSYTADTLPAYVPKGYAAELAECQRYYYKETEQYAVTPYYFSTTERYYTVMLPVKMRIAPTVTYSNVSGEYKDGWAKTNATVTVSATSISHFTMLCSGGTVTETERPLLFMTYEASADL